MWVNSATNAATTHRPRHHRAQSEPCLAPQRVADGSQINLTQAARERRFFLSTCHNKLTLQRSQ